MNKLNIGKYRIRQISKSKIYLQKKSDVANTRLSDTKVYVNEQSFYFEVIK